MINGHVHLGVVQRRNAGEHNRGPVCLDSRPGIEVVDVLEENAHGNLLIRVISCHVDADKGNKLDFRMFLQGFYDILLG